ALLLDIQPGDEVIMPSYTFVSTANAFVLRGAKIVFVDVRPDINTSVLTPSFSIYFCLHFIQNLDIPSDILKELSLHSAIFFSRQVLTMHSTEVQAKPLFSWKALG
ncbi:DegT/DnrJ/EryC1/StrS family aminotransferase, partial [Escherichia coli]|uniref:DegT/DnrJ/EryC1/StrS family aminotransferase n=1 Tax=Escherichia coli TaxID=562 RepID=UPI002108AF00